MPNRAQPENRCRLLLLLALLGVACSRGVADPPPPPARNDIAAAAPGARGAHPAFASARPVAVEEPPHAVPAPGQPDEDDEADDGGAPPEAPAKPDGVAL